MWPNHRLDLIESGLYFFLFFHNVASLLAPLCRRYRFYLATIRKQWLLFDDLKPVMNARSADKYSKAFKHIKNTCDHPLFGKLILNGRPPPHILENVDALWCKQKLDTESHRFFVTINDYLILEDIVFPKSLIIFYAHFFFQLFSTSDNYLGIDVNCRGQTISCHPRSYPSPFLSWNFGQCPSLRCYTNLNRLEQRIKWTNEWKYYQAMGYALS